MTEETKFIYAGFWNRFAALVIDSCIVSIIVFPFALIIGLMSPSAILVEIPFNLFTTTIIIEKTPNTIERNFDGSTSVVEQYIEKESVFGLWENYYKVRTTKSNGNSQTSTALIDPSTQNTIDKTSSSDIELVVIFIYWILLEASVYQGSIGKKIMGLKVVTASGGKPTLLDATSRNLLKTLSALTIFIGFMMAGWTARKQALHDKIPNMLVINTRLEKKSAE
jgi:uncharacterized RDD family membrane protein YckC